MPPIMADPFEHEMGFHCATTALRSLLKHFGVDFSEPMCLGLGMGLNFFYGEGEDFNPTRYFMSRSGVLEEDFFRILRIDAPMKRHDGVEQSWSGVKGLVEKQHPVMVQVDIEGLPYYNTRTHFAGHKVLIAGFDPETEDVFISDSEFPDLQVVTLDQIQRARFFPDMPWDLSYQWWDLRSVRVTAPLEEAVPRALSECAKRIVGDETGLFGISAMRRMTKSLPDWDRTEDWQWCARFGYQVIEKRGTGGGGFRNKYAEFLSEAACYDPRIEKLDLVRRMEEIAASWTAFAEMLLQISDLEEPSGFDEAAKIFGKLTGREESFFTDVLRAEG